MQSQVSNYHVRLSRVHDRKKAEKITPAREMVEKVSVAAPLVAPAPAAVPVRVAEPVGRADVPPAAVVAPGATTVATPAKSSLLAY